jgi:hypothetical protein
MKTIKDMLDYIESECKKIDVEESFDRMLDECYSFDSVGGPFAHMSPSRVLREMDPIAHRVGVSEHSDSEDWYEINGDYYERRDVIHTQGYFIDDLESDLADLQGDLDDEEDADEPSDAEINRLKGAISELEALIKECRDYSF